MTTLVDIPVWMENSKQAAPLDEELCTINGF